MTDDAPDDDAERGVRRKHSTRAKITKPRSSWAFAGAFDWARDPVAFVALSVACIFIVAF